MATSRPSIPAVPTVVGATDDSSRGGLFSRSNLANPVSGADVNGVPIQDSTITFTVNGEAFTGNSFTLNQDNDQTINFVVSGTGGGTGPADGNNYVTGGSITNGILTLEREGLADLPVTGQIIGDVQSSALTGLVNTIIGMASIHALSDTPNAFGTAGQILAVNTAGDGLVYINPPTATVSADSFSSADDTVTATAGTGDDSGTVSLVAAPSWTGNTQEGGVRGTVQATRIVLDGATGFRLRDDGDGVYTITLPGEPPPVDPGPREGPSSQMDPTSNVFSAPGPATLTVPVSGGTIFGTSNDDTRVVTSLSRNGQGVSGTMPTITVSNDRDSITVSYPGDDVDELGMYEIGLTPTVTPTGGGDPVQLDEVMSDAFNRIVPFFQSRVQITAANINDASVTRASDAVWSGSFIVNPPGATSGSLYFAVRTSEFLVTGPNRFIATSGGPMPESISTNFGPIGSTFTINDHNGDPVIFQTYRTARLSNGDTAAMFMGDTT